MTGWRTALLVAGKELRETLRDRRTLVMMLLIPTLLYPGMMVAVEQIALLGQRALDREPAVIAVAGADAEFAAFLEADTTIRVAPSELATPEAVRARQVEAAIHLRHSGAAPGGTVQARVLYDGSSERSQRAREVAWSRLGAWSDTLLQRRLRGAGLPPDFAAPLDARETSVATAAETGGYALGRFLPVLLILMTLLGTFYPAIDLGAGEKERGTLETLLTAPVPPRHVVAGKFLAVALVGMTAAIVNLASMLLTFQSGLFRFAQAAEIQFSLPPSAMLLVLLALVPLAVLFAALFLGISVRAQSFKEAQNALTPVQLASILPVMVVMLPGIEFGPALAVVPVLGVALLFRELMAGTADLLPALLAVGATAAYAAGALAFAARSFGREEVLFGGGEGTVARRPWRARVTAWRGAGGRVPTPAEGILFIAAVALLFFHVGNAFHAAWGERGILASSWLLLGVPAVAFALLGPYRARRTLALRAPGGRTLAAALLIALGGIPVGLTIGWLQLQLFPGAAEALAGLEALVTATTAERALWLLLLVAVTPAICEELAFRGVFLQSLGSTLGKWQAVGASALVFGAFHLSFETALRFLPTAWIGLLLGWVVWHSRSVFASMLMHFVNNAAVVLLLWQPELRQLLLRDDAPAWWTVAAAPVLLAVGVWLLPRRPGENATPPAESANTLQQGASRW